MSFDEALDYMRTVDPFTLSRSGGDASSEAAITAICKGYASSQAQYLDTSEQSRSASLALTTYSIILATRARTTADVKNVSCALICVDVSSIIRIDWRDASQLIDRLITILGPVEDATTLLESAKNLKLSQSLMDLLEIRVGKSQDQGAHG